MVDCIDLICFVLFCFVFWVVEFEFTTGAHDVAKVTKAAFDACNSTNPISHKTTGPANFTLDTSGEHYFICTVGTHCSLGQKLAVNVSAARAETEFIVGDSLGWTVPSGGAVTYQNWAANKTFVVGDSLSKLTEKSNLEAG